MSSVKKITNYQSFIIGIILLVFAVVLEALPLTFSQIKSDYINTNIVGLVSILAAIFLLFPIIRAAYYIFKSK